MWHESLVKNYIGLTGYPDLWAPKVLQYNYLMKYEVMII